MNENEKLEAELLLQAIYQKYGYDFRSYAKASIRRRIKKHQAVSGFASISAMQHELIHNEQFFTTLLKELTVNVTEMFRDPDYFFSFRNQVIPVLAEKDHIQIWHAGCASGEEVYSMAIMLEEEGLAGRYRIYATDTCSEALNVAREGIYPVAIMQEGSVNYQKAGGRRSLSEYYTAHYDHVVMADRLKANLVFSEHNLVTDAVFSEMDCVVCRNVLIYFSRVLQDRVFKLFYDALPGGGFLFLGSKEHVRFSNLADKFVKVCGNEKIFKKVG
ncbi:MAG: protein-glutamate O-methyltransferase CheR [Deltaproteobacteria bacterium]|nr:protein-glutamate O-methyltransferase CheR [Deltaproteobacteria bacterium]